MNSKLLLLLLFFKLINNINVTNTNEPYKCSINIMNYVIIL